jgi:hypothetical protein
MINGIKSDDADDGDKACVRNFGLWPIIDAAGRASKINRNVGTSLKVLSQN